MIATKSFADRLIMADANVQKLTTEACKAAKKLPEAKGRNKFIEVVTEAIFQRFHEMRGEQRDKQYPTMALRDGVSEAARQCGMTTYKDTQNGDNELDKLCEALAKAGIWSTRVTKIGRVIAPGGHLNKESGGKFAALLLKKLGK